MKREPVVTVIVILMAVLLSYIGLYRKWMPTVSAEVESRAVASLEEDQSRDAEEGMQAVYDIRESRDYERYLISSESLSVVESVIASVSEQQSLEAYSRSEEESYSSHIASVSAQHSAEASLMREAAADERERDMAIMESRAASIEASIEESSSIEASRAEESRLAASRAEESRIAASKEESRAAASRAEESRAAASRAAEESSRAAASREAQATTAATTAATPTTTAAPTTTGQVVFVGDSRTAGFIGAGLMPRSRCFVYPGACYAWYDNVRSAAAVKPAKVVFFGGMNDLGVWASDDTRFYNEYSALIKYFCSLSPNSVVYVNKIIPATQAAIQEFPGRAKVNEFNQRIAQMCAENGWICIDTSAGFQSAYYTGDGIHFNAAWYPIWWRNLKEKVGF